MTNILFSPGFNFYQSANADSDKVKENFLIRTNELNIILEDLHRQPEKGSVQHFLLLGRRGSGKSTLLKRIQIEIETNENLKSHFIAINLAEEQANIYKLYDLLEAVIDELEYFGIVTNLPNWKNNSHQYARDLFDIIHNTLEKCGRKLVLLLDNIDRIFENMDEDASLLREYLINYDDIKIIGGSTKMTEHFWMYNKPFYEFFRVLELSKLTSDEIKSLLLSWSNRLNIPELKNFIQNKPGQLETIRLLTDGLPRTLQFFVNILLTRTQETGYEYLRLIMDSVTPLYQERLNSLPPSQRKIVLQMAFLWESVGAKEIGFATKMDTKVISAQLKQLTSKGLVDRIETSTKNNLYRLSERFFNLWLIFTQGSPKEKRKAKCLTIFLENFYDAQEIILIATQHLKMLQSGNFAANKAALITKALAQSRYINFSLRDKLIDNTLALENMAHELRSQLPPTSKQIVDEIRDSIINNDYKKALRIASEFEQEDGFREFLIGYIYKMQEKNIQAEIFLQNAYNKDFKYGALALAEVYFINKKFNLAEEYFLIALNQDFIGAEYKLGKFYVSQNKWDLAEPFLLKAIEKMEWNATFELGAIYSKSGREELAEKYFKIGIEHNIIGSAISLAILYYFQNNSKDLVEELIEKEKSIVKKEYTVINVFSIIVNVWKGHLKDLESKCKNHLQNGTGSNSNLLLFHLMVHHQVNLVVKLFGSPELGTKLIDENLPLYYVALSLNSVDKNLNLKIPPELIEIVEDQKTSILKMREIYY